MCSLFNRANCIQDVRIRGSGPSLVCTVASCSSPADKTAILSTNSITEWIKTRFLQNRADVHACKFSEGKRFTETAERSVDVSPAENLLRDDRKLTSSDRDSRERKKKKKKQLAAYLNWYWYCVSLYLAILTPSSRQPSETPKRYPAPGSPLPHNWARSVDRTVRRRLQDPTRSMACSRKDRGVAASRKTSFGVSSPPRATRTASHKFRYYYRTQGSAPYRRRSPPGHPA